MKKLLSALILSLLLPLSLFAETTPLDSQKWDAMIETVRARAAAENISDATIAATLDDAQFIPRTISSDRKQPEKKESREIYIAARVNAGRIDMGREKKREYRTYLARAETKYGVPRDVILALWGMESNFGRYMSSHKLSDTMLTLIYDGRRETFFTNQLIALMKISDADNVAIADLRGSWAGALGHFQFIPTTLLAYGVDGDGDGKIDVINSIPDAIFSAANYLNKLKFNANEKIVRAVKIPANFDWTLTSGTVKKTVDEWTVLGLRQTNGKLLPRSKMNAALIAEYETADDGAVTQTGRAFLTYDNFDRLKRWNNSTNFALSIALLAQEF